MTRGESLRSALAFGLLACAVVALFVRLVDLQLLKGPGTRSAIAMESTVLPASRGTLLDRFGEPLAWDRPIYEVRVSVEGFAGLPTKNRPTTDRRTLAQGRDRLVSELVFALAKDRARFASIEQQDALRKTLRERIERGVEKAFAKGESRFDMLVDRVLDDANAIHALRSLDVRRAPPPARGEIQPFRLYFDFMPRWEREYVAEDSLTGLIGRVQPGPLRLPGADGKQRLVDDRIPVFGLERLLPLVPGAAGSAALRTDAFARTYWTADRREPESPVDLRTTIDPALQVRADEELDVAAEAIREHYGHPPEWGALVLIDARSGGVVAAASYVAGKDGKRDRNAAFTPAQRVFEPGSVVKPLHVSMVAERGLLDWNEPIDVRRGYLAGSDRIGPNGRLPRREIRDDHPNEVLDPRQVLIRSSNIGAVKLGLRLGAEGIEDYLQTYRFGERTAIGYPGELAGSRPKPIPSLPPSEQLAYAGPSVLFGYQIGVTPFQLARAFLSFVSGRQRELHVVEAVGRDGAFRPLELPRDGVPFLSGGTLADIRATLVGVVEEEHGTARGIGKWLRELRARRGSTEPILGGKTGTSQYVGKTTRWDGSAFHGDIRTSSFAGFTPVDEPRFLVVCVFQKAGAGAFYGGLYAAPAAARLLVAALDREAAAWRPKDSDRSESGSVAVGPEPGGSGQSQRR